MRFLLYNIRYGTARKRPVFPWSGYFSKTKPHIATITEYIRELDPDIVGLVEVDAGSFRTGKTHQAEMMAESLGHFHSYCPKYCSTTRVASLPVMKNQGNAFLAKDTIVKEKFHFFTRGVKRLVIELELENVIIFLVHLSLGFKARHGQLEQLSNFISNTEKPCIVAGDFNVLWGESEINLFLKATGLVDANNESLPTFPAWKPKRHLDFILHSPEIKISDFFVPNVEFSDHLPLVLDFTAP